MLVPTLCAAKCVDLSRLGTVLGLALALLGLLVLGLACLTREDQLADRVVAELSPAATAAIAREWLAAVGCPASPQPSTGGDSSWGSEFAEDNVTDAIDGGSESSATVLQNSAPPAAAAVQIDCAALAVPGAVAALIGAHVRSQLALIGGGVVVLATLVALRVIANVLLLVNSDRPGWREAIIGGDQSAASGDGAGGAGGAASNSEEEMTSLMDGHK